MIIITYDMDAILDESVYKIYIQLMEKLLVQEAKDMDVLKMNLENCYGIQKLNQTIDYSNKNVAIIYAPNGTMKSSLAKTFEAIRDKRPVEEKVFGYQSLYSIEDENEVDIPSQSIMVINPFDENAYENQGLLMANETLRKQYLLIHRSIEDKRNKLYLEIKGKLKYTSRNSFDTRGTMLSDWGYLLKEEYVCLENILNMLYEPEMNCLLKEDELDYNALFNDKVYSMITTGKTAEMLEEYEKKYAELVDKSLFMKKGVIDHNNYGDISNVLGNNGFFEVKNEIILNAKDGSRIVSIKSQKELDELIAKEKEQVLNTKEIKELFDKINKLISKNKDTQAFNKFLQSHPDVVSEYRDVDLFKKKVWLKAFASCEMMLRELLAEYKKAQNDLSELRKKAKEENTDWKKALDVFSNRFFVPFRIEPSNQEDVILNQDIPSFKYIFSDNRGSKEIAKECLIEDVLSTGERRAYYILNMIFQILVAKKEESEKLIVMDDVSESFDYKNKYAIIEYISDIAAFVNRSGKSIFKILILTHNFDFYRTVASRITKPNNSYIAFSDEGEIKFNKGLYTKNLFGHYKKKIVKGGCDNIVVASIPFVRNIIEYTEDDKNSDYLLLTSILHYKNNTHSITLKAVQDIFNQYWCKGNNVNFSDGRENELVYDLIMSEADKITDIEKLEIENKLILSIATRLIAEKYMINRIMSDVPNGSDIINNIYLENSQGGRLVTAYRDNINDENMGILDVVAMITPENIHINSFMFEPILDMSSKKLYEVYQSIKLL